MSAMDYDMEKEIAEIINKHYDYAIHSKSGRKQMSLQKKLVKYFKLKLEGAETEGLRCPKCGKKTNLAQQMVEWDKYYGADVSIDQDDTWAMISVFCPHCDDYSWLIDISAAGKTKEVEMLKGPFPKGSKVNIPTTDKDERN